MNSFNYCAHAIEDIEKDEYPMHPIEKSMSLEFAKLLRSSIKFILPENGRLLNLNKADQKNIDYFKLPYDVVSAEFQMASYLVTEFPDQTVVKKRIALAFTTKAAPKILVDAARIQCHGNGIYVWPINYFDPLGRWLIDPFGAFFPEETNLMHGEFVYNGHGKTKIKEVGVGFLPLMFGTIGQSAADALYSRYGEKEATARIIGSTREECQAINEMCLVLNCSNVNDNEIITPPKFLNKKRKKKGKVPFFEYRILTVKQSDNNDKKPPIGGTHASPRVHLRRGHIRHLPSGSTTFVQPCVVGDKKRGVIHKDYRVTE